MDIHEVVIREAVKVTVAALSGVALSGSRRLVRLLRARLSKLPPEPGALRELMERQVAADPGFVDEVAEVLAEAGHPGTGAVSPYPSEPFVDRDTLRQEVAGGTGVWTIVGPRDIGKTSLVQRIAHDVRERFPHGQIYVDLDDWREGEAPAVSAVQAYVLGQLGVDEVAAPAPQVYQQYLSAPLQRRFVLILENAQGSAELRQLAVPWPRSLVLVTARWLPDDLRMWADPRRLRRLSGLDDEGAWQLLADCVGEELLAAEPGAAKQLLELCDRMPQPIRYVAGRLQRRHGQPGVVAAELARLQTAGPGKKVAQGVQLTLEELTPPAAAGLAALAIHPGSVFGFPSVEAMLGPGEEEVLDELVDSQLVESHRGRLRLPHTVRAVVTRQVELPADRADHHFVRLLDFYCDHAVAADLATGRDRLRCYRERAVTPQLLSGVDPIEWLEVESTAIAALIKQAHRRAHHVEVVQLCGALEVLTTHRGHYWRCAEAFSWGIRSAAALGEPAPLARLRAFRGRLLSQLHEFDQAIAEIDAAAALLPQLHDKPLLVSSVWEFQARVREERADEASNPHYQSYQPSIEYLTRAVQLDQQGNERRSLHIHQRMLANVLVKAGQPEPALAVCRSIAPLGEHRNDARVQMVAAKAYTAVGELPLARAALADARNLLHGTKANQYELELADIDAELAWRAGDTAGARAGWDWIANQLHGWGHPRAYRYFTKLDVPLPAPA